MLFTVALVGKCISAYIFDAYISIFDFNYFHWIGWVVPGKNRFSIDVQWCVCAAQIRDYIVRINLTCVFFFLCATFILWTPFHRTSHTFHQLNLYLYIYCQLSHFTYASNTIQRWKKKHPIRGIRIFSNENQTKFTQAKCIQPENRPWVRQLKERERSFQNVNLHFNRFQSETKRLPTVFMFIQTYERIDLFLVHAFCLHYGAGSWVLHLRFARSHTIFNSNEPNNHIIIIRFHFKSHFSFFSCGSLFWLLMLALVSLFAMQRDVVSIVFQFFRLWSQKIYICLDGICFLLGLTVLHPFFACITL